MAINGAGTEGVDRFVRSILGGTGIRARAAAQGRQEALREALTGSQVDNTRAEAALRQNKLTNLDPALLGPAIAGAFGIPSEQGGNLAVAANAGEGNLAELAQAMRTAQITSSQRAARNEALNGNYNGANANLFGVANGPQKLAAIEGGMSLNPLATPDSQNISPTDVGKAMITADLARAGASNASAARSRAGINADKAGNYETIDTGEGGLVRHNKLTNVVDSILGADNQPVHKVENTGSPTAVPENMIDAIVGKVTNADGVATPDPEGYQQFLQWQTKMAATDPRYNNGSFAAARYATNAPIGSTIAQTVTEPTKLDGKTPAKPVVRGAPLAPEGIDPSAAAAIADPKQPAAQMIGNIVQHVLGQGAPDAQSSEAAPGQGAVLNILNGGSAAPTAPQPSAMAQPGTQEEFDALPVGTPYKRPDGSIWVKGH